MEDSFEMEEIPTEYTLKDLLREVHIRAPISKDPIHHKYMQKAIELAKKSQPDDGGPYVGAVIVKDGKILAEAYKVREPWHNRIISRRYLHLCHAEEKAIDIAGTEAKGATLYVTLEPCTQRNIQGRKRVSDTPCVDLIQQAGISKVVIGMLDKYNPDIICRGALTLIDSGIKVVRYHHGLYKNLKKLLEMGYMRRESKQKEYLSKKYENMKEKDESGRMNKITKIEGGKKRKSNRVRRIINQGIADYYERKNREN
jgi:diaminohydroxyphosphoribosylaminopyrimidine deaminase/5-amino-6-(5-phosphoribosylamino)uracil reductase